MSDLALKLDGLAFEVFEISATADTQNAKSDVSGASFSEQQDRIFETLMSFQDAEDNASANLPDAPAQMLESAVHMIRAVFRINAPLYQ